jgi:hypothetical protein
MQRSIATENCFGLVVLYSIVILYSIDSCYLRVKTILALVSSLCLSLNAIAGFERAAKELQIVIRIKIDGLVCSKCRLR